MVIKIAAVALLKIVNICSASVSKVLTYKNGALLLVNGGFSTVITLTFYFNELLLGTSVKKLVLPIMIYLIGFVIYHMLSLVDLITGLMNAKYQNSIAVNPDKNYIKPYRLWFTVWKNLGVSILNLLLMFLCFLAEIIQSSHPDDDFVSTIGSGLYMTLIWIFVTSWGMASLFDFISIGQNIERRTGIKYRIFILAEKITNIAQKRIILKAKNSMEAIEESNENSQKIEDNEKID